jgi:hypothetical protein
MLWAWLALRVVRRLYCTLWVALRFSFPFQFNEVKVCVFSLGNEANPTAGATPSWRPWHSLSRPRQRIPCPIGSAGSFVAAVTSPQLACLSADIVVSSRLISSQMMRGGKALFSSLKILQNFSNSPSHRIFRCMYEVLNIDKNKN